MITPSLTVNPLKFQNPKLPSLTNQQMKIARLKPMGFSRSEKTINALKITFKVLFAPFTLIGYLFYKCVSKFTSSRGICPPPKARLSHPELQKALKELNGEEIRFGFHQGSILEGMFFNPLAPLTKPKTVLICAGSGAPYEFCVIPMVKEFLSMGHRVMVFNYEGVGKSEGNRSENGVYRSTEAAYQYLKQVKEFNDDEIVAWGYSLGSGAVSNLAQKHKIDVVLDRGFSTMSEVAAQMAPKGLKTIARLLFFIGSHFNNLKKLKKAKGRIFIAQGTQDWMMDEHLHGKKLHNALPHAIFKRVNSSHGHDHNIWFSKGADREFIRQFLTSQS